VCNTWAAVCLRSVTPAEIVAAIAQQTGRELEKRDVELPEIKTVGTFDARVRLHPEVFGEFKVVVQREKGT
jgi:large subunit ribosomal protein L9